MVMCLCVLINICLQAHTCDKLFPGSLKYLSKKKKIQSPAEIPKFLNFIICCTRNDSLAKEVFFCVCCKNFVKTFLVYFRISCDWLIYMYKSEKQSWALVMLGQNAHYRKPNQIYLKFDASPRQLSQKFPLQFFTCMQ